MCDLLSYFIFSVFIFIFIIFNMESEHEENR